ncbi:hypothetical protein H4R19_006900, partial [Coemansia spiralis]
NRAAAGSKDRPDKQPHCAPPERALRRGADEPKHIPGAKRRGCAEEPAGGPGPQADGRSGQVPAARAGVAGSVPAANGKVHTHR